MGILKKASKHKDACVQLVLNGHRMLHSSSAQNKPYSVPKLFKVALAQYP